MGVCFGVHCSRRAFVYACVCKCSNLSDFSARAFLVVSRISWEDSNFGSSSRSLAIFLSTRAALEVQCNYCSALEFSPSLSLSLPC